MKKFIHTAWFKKTIIATTCVIAAAIPITLLSVNWTNIKIIYAAGSSAVAPLLTDIAAAYDKFDGHKNKIEVNVLATGSGNGLESVVNNTKNFGNVSWAPDKSKIKDTKDVKALTAWSENKIKTLTLGIDGIGVIYKPMPNSTYTLNIDANNIDKLFETVSGNKVHTFGDLLNDPKITTKIAPYARTGGAAKSGTTDAFLKDSGFKVDKNAQYYKNLSNGQYGIGVESTRESNVETWKQISSNGGKVGALTYLSAGFIINNQEEIAKSGFKVATYSGIELSLDKVTNGYNWYRPLNTLFSISNASDAIKEWVHWFYNNYFDNRISDVIKQIGVVPLNSDQHQSMAARDGIMTSDFDIQAYEQASDDYKWGAQLK